MNIYQQMRARVLAALEEMTAEGVLPAGLPFDAITAEPPRDASHGDIATNAAMVLAKPAGKNPREIAALLAQKLAKVEDVSSAEVAGPGFINLKVEDAVWQGLVREILRLGGSYGNAETGAGRKVNVEYVSANPTGPMHIGHARGAVVGDVLALLLIKAGFDVTREYYINDAGAQVEKLARSAYLRYREACGEAIGEIPEGLYPGDYLKVAGESFREQHDRRYLNVPEAEWMPILKPFAVDTMMVLIRRDLAELGIAHDVFTSERALIERGAVDAGIAFLEARGLVYQGILEAPKGKAPEDWEPRAQTLFRAGQFGDDTDRPLRKSDGSPTYFASDIAYHHDKLVRGFTEMVLCLGADHGGYVKRLKAAVAALSGGKASLDVLLYQLVNFMENGAPLKMSKRAGTYITVRDVVEAVGKDVTRFIMLTRKHSETLDFDLRKVTEQSKDNPVFYVQYAYARISSVLRHFAETLPDAAREELSALSPETLGLLSDPRELALIRKMAEWPRVVESAAIAREPHRVAFYLQELAGMLHALWNAGKEQEELRFLMPDAIELSKARMALIKACAVTLASGLRVMGVEPMAEM